jgi:hypothetical protein
LILSFLWLFYDIFFLSCIDPYMEINGIARRIDVPLADFAAAIGEYVQKIDPEPRPFTPGGAHFLATCSPGNLSASGKTFPC